MFKVLVKYEITTFDGGQRVVKEKTRAAATRNTYQAAYALAWRIAARGLGIIHKNKVVEIIPFPRIWSIKIIEVPEELSEEPED